jgi:hypothetical protein
MTTKEIKIRMLELDINVAFLADKLLKCPRSTAYALINKKFKSDRLEKKLAKALGIKLEVLKANGNGGDS